jgi:gamma-glutamyltranspeptidase/glutathione hydrolase
VLPAVKLAQEGLLVDWYSGLITASSAKALSLDPDAAAMFLDEGTWPILGSWTGSAERHLDQRALAATLQQIAEGGPRALYEGPVARALAQDIQAKGGCLAEADLAAYQAAWADPLVVPYRGGQVYAAPGLTGGPTFAQALRALESELQPGNGPDARAYQAMARTLDAAFRTRLADMGDHESPTAPPCTTHFSVVDRHGNMCSVTQTLLSIFGSRVVSPSTGLLLNNGIMWFDPEPGKPNSLAPGKRVLANYCPVVGVGADGRQFAVGASGGRKILGAVMQLSSFLLDHGMTLEQAFHQPRIDVSGGGQVIADQALGPDILQALAQVLPVVPRGAWCSPTCSPARPASCGTAAGTWAAPRSCRRGAMRWQARPADRLLRHRIAAHEEPVADANAIPRQHEDLRFVPRARRRGEQHQQDVAHGIGGQGHAAVQALP